MKPAPWLFTVICATWVCGALMAPDVMFGLGGHFESGAKVSIAVDGQDKVLAVVESSDRIYYKFGHVAGLTVQWDGSELVDSGSKPAVALNNRGDVIVLFQRSNFFRMGQLYYRV